MITKISIIVYYKKGLKIIIEINFFDYVSNGVFSQFDKNKQLYFIVFFFKKVESY